MHEISTGYDEIGSFNSPRLAMVSDYVTGRAEAITKPKMLLANLFDDQDGNLIFEGEFTIDDGSLGVMQLK